MNNNKLKKYFRVQKLWGVFTIMLGIAMCLLGDALLMLIFCGLGSYLLFTKEMVWTNDYFFEVQKEKESE